MVSLLFEQEVKASNYVTTSAQLYDGKERNTGSTLFLQKFALFSLCALGLLHFLKFGILGFNTTVGSLTQGQ